MMPKASNSNLPDGFHHSDRSLGDHWWFFLLLSGIKFVLWHFSAGKGWILRFSQKFTVSTADTIGNHRKHDLGSPRVCLVSLGSDTSARSGEKLSFGPKSPSGAPGSTQRREWHTAMTKGISIAIYLVNPSILGEEERWSKGERKILTPPPRLTLYAAGENFCSVNPKFQTELRILIFAAYIHR